MISISHSPNSTLRQMRKAAAWFFLPWRWSACKTGQSVFKLENYFKTKFKARYAKSFSQGREAFYALLQAAGIAEGDEVIIQAYTCIVVPNSVLWVGATPVFVDIDQTFNIDPDLIESKISSRTKAVVVQHAFGVPADINKIKQICQQRGLILIEDCALSLGAKVGDQEVGTFGDAAFFSFGRDKVISSVSGGLAIAHHQEIAKNLVKATEKLSSRSYLWIVQNLVHILKVPIATKVMGRLKIGQLSIKFLQSIGLLNRVYQDCEKLSDPPKTLMHHLPNAMADLALQQLEDLKRFNEHRQKLAGQYKKFCDKNNLKYQQSLPNTDPIYLRFAMLVKNPKELITAAKRKGILLGDWYSSVVVPEPKEWNKINYQPGSAPQAEEFSKQSVNLPTHHKMQEKHVSKLLSILEEHLK